VPESTEQQLTIEAQAQEIGSLTARLARLEAQLRGERCRTQQLLRRIHELEAHLGQDSHNSNKPPSTDLPQHKRTRNLRRPSGRLVGGQPGHAGHSRPRERHPDEVIIHAPVQCRGCGSSLDSQPAVGEERRQVLELPPVKVWVIEHRAATKRCRRCERTTKGQFPPEVRATLQYGAGVQARAVYLTQYQLLPVERSCELLRDLFGYPVSPATIQRSSFINY
jgi:transposase